MISKKFYEMIQYPNLEDNTGLLTAQEGSPAKAAMECVKTTVIWFQRIVLELAGALNWYSKFLKSENPGVVLFKEVRATIYSL
jgi:hypothetical protein